MTTASYWLMTNPAGSMFLVVGGAAFRVAPVEANAMGLTGGTTIPLVPMPSTPVDGTLVQEYGSAEVYVIYGGYPFKLPTPETLFALGFNWGQVRSIPSVGLRQLLPMPIDGTLVKELPETVRLEGPRHDHLLRAGGPVDDPGVYLVDNQKLRHVTSTTAMEENCLPWRHVRTVPAGSLAPFEAGPDLGP